jgi:peroxiredoxin
MPVKRGWLLFMTLALLCIGISLIILQQRGGDAEPEVRPEVGYLAPDFALPTLDGQTVRLSDFRGKKAVFLNFWATWCSPCRLEMPTMETAYQDYKGRGLEILAVSLDAGPKSAVKNFMQELKLTYPALQDPDMEVLRLYRMFSLPASFLIDKQGIIRFREVGYRDWTDPESRKLIEAILP